MAPGTARRRALDDALAEIESGRTEPSPEWKVRYALMLGLERVLSEKPPHLASGLELRRHQVDALAGMLTELIAANQRQVEAAFTNGHLPERPRSKPRRKRRTTASPPPPVGEEEELPELTPEQDPGAIRRFRFRHPTASGKTIAAAGFVEAARTVGVLILTHRRLLVNQFRHDLTETGYAKRLTDVILRGHRVRKSAPITIQTYAWFARHYGEVEPSAYQLVICDEAHTALGEKTSAAIRGFPDPIFIGMTATEQLIAKQVSDVFPASVDDLPLQDAARRGLIAPLRCLRVPPVAAIHSVPIVGGDFDERALAQVLDHTALNQAAASLYRDRFDDTPGIVYAAGVDHAYNLAQEFRAAGLKAEAVSGRTPPVKLAETLAAYERGEINVLINAMLLAEGWNSPARHRLHAPCADRVAARLPAANRPDHAHPPAQGGRHRRRFRSQVGHAQREGDLAPLAARRRLLPRGRPGDAGAATANAAPGPQAPRSRRLAGAGHARGAATTGRDRARVAASRPQVPRRRRAALLGDDRRAQHPLRGTGRVRSQAGREQYQQGRSRAVPLHLRGRELESPAALDGAGRSRRHARSSEPTTTIWSRSSLRRRPGRRSACRGSAYSSARLPKARRSRLSRSSPAGSGGSRAPAARPRIARPAPTSPMPSACSAPSPTPAAGATRRTSPGSSTPRASRPLHVGAALLASAEGYTPRANQLIEAAREQLASVSEIAAALAENLPAPKLQSNRRRRRRKRRPGAAQTPKAEGQETPAGEAAR